LNDRLGEVVGDLFELNDALLTVGDLHGERPQLLALGVVALRLRRNGRVGRIQCGIDISPAIAQQRPLEAALRDGGTLGAAADATALPPCARPELPELKLARGFAAVTCCFRT